MWSRSNNNNNNILAGTYYTYTLGAHMHAICSDQNVFDSRDSNLYSIPFRPMSFCWEPFCGGQLQWLGVCLFCCVEFFLDPLYQAFWKRISTRPIWHSNWLLNLSNCCKVQSISSINHTGIIINSHRIQINVSWEFTSSTFRNTTREISGVFASSLLFVFFLSFVLSQNQIA